MSVTASIPANTRSNEQHGRQATFVWGVTADRGAEDATRYYPTVFLAEVNHERNLVPWEMTASYSPTALSFSPSKPCPSHQLVQFLKVLDRSPGNAKVNKCVFTKLLQVLAMMCRSESVLIHYTFYLCDNLQYLSPPIRYSSMYVLMATFENDIYMFKYQYFI